MPIFLRQSTASQEVPLGYFVDSTDGNSEETALTINNTDIHVWKTGATTLANKNSGGGTHISNGIYYAVLDATDTDTIGPLVLFVHVTGALSVRLECCVLDEAVFDALFGTTALATGTIPTAAAIADQVWDEATAGHATAGSEGKALTDVLAFGAPPAASVVADAVWDEASAGHTDAGKAGAQMWTDVDAILEDTGTTLDGRIPAALTGGKMESNIGSVTAGVIAAGSFAAGALDAVWSTAARVLTAATNITAGIADAVWDEAIAGHAGAGSTGEALSAANNGAPPAASAIADAVWDEATAGHVGAGSAGKALTDANNGTPPTAAAIADQVWDEAQADHVGAGSTGASLNGATAPTAGAVADAVWDEARADHVAAGSFGQGVASVQGNVTGSTASVTGAVGSVTGNVGGNVAGSVASVTGAVGSVTGNVGGNVAGSVASVTGAVGSVTGNVTGSVGSLAAQAKADVNAEVVDALNVDTYAEPGQGAPAATASITAKLGYLFKAWRNRTTQDATDYKLYGDDAVTVDQKAAVSDDAVTFDRGEVGTGP